MIVVDLSGSSARARLVQVSTASIAASGIQSGGRIGVSLQHRLTNTVAFRLRCFKLFGILIFSVVTFGAQAASATVARTNSEELLLKGWRVTQDVRDFGDRQKWFRPEFEDDWQPIDRLTHLQLLLAKQPYFGRELRYFNEHAWWYRVDFNTENLLHGTTLRFEGVDYFAKVWLNGVLLGEHEGYADPFEFEVGEILRADDRPNVLVVKVTSPWDWKYRDLLAIDTQYPYFSVERNLLKGSYEHADTFVQRDVNPIGIWRPVKLITHDDIWPSAQPAVSTELTNGQRKVNVSLAWLVNSKEPVRKALLFIDVREKDTKREVARLSRPFQLKVGTNLLRTTATIDSPKLWTTWDRGAQPLYEAKLRLAAPDGTTITNLVSFGIRSVELRRTSAETRFFINGKPIYLRGAAYWSDLYLSNANPDRYERDIRAAIHAGINAFRVHMHVENPEFYAICDRLGVVLIQDNDLNWVFPDDPEFSNRAIRHFGTLMTLLNNHPSVIAWIAMNEVGFDANLKPGHRTAAEKALGARLVAEAFEKDSTRPVIENSMDYDDPASGDRHDYRGSLDKGTYFDIAGSRDKLITEFGVDAPPIASNLRLIPEVANRLADVVPRISELQNYQYQLLKFYIEHYRIQKYAPNSGYFQFMWIDFSPQSFYGVYDYWGTPKTGGSGGGLRALQESNQPIGIFMEHDTEPRGLFAVNDSSIDLGDCIARWRVANSTEVLAEDSQNVRLRPDSVVKIRDMNFPVKAGESYRIELSLTSENGRVLAKNSYTNPFEVRPLPEGYPDRMDDELGVRLWWATKLKSH